MHQPARFISLNPSYRFPSGKKLALTGSYTYGLRWTIDAENKKNIGHSGGLPGFGSNWQFLPDYGVGVILFANVTYAPTTQINTAVMDTLVQLAKLQPRQISVSPILAKRQQELIKIIPSWENTGVIFAENFFDDYPIDMLKAESANLFKEVGPIEKVNNMIAENQLRGYCIIECKNGKLKLTFTLTPENPATIQEYHLTKE
jgi:hypothetical protein